MGAGAVAELVIRNLIKLPAINTDPELVRGMEAQIKLQEEDGGLNADDLHSEEEEDGNEPF